jgi:hypothetical protein
VDKRENKSLFGLSHFLTEDQLVQIYTELQKNAPFYRKFPLKHVILTVGDYKLEFPNRIELMEFKIDNDALSSLNSHHLNAQIQAMRSEPSVKPKRLSLVASFSDEYLSKIGPKSTLTLVKRIYHLKRDFPQCMIFITQDSFTKKSGVRTAMEVGLEHWLNWGIEAKSFEKEKIAPILERTFEKGPIHSIAAAVNDWTEEKTLNFLLQAGENFTPGCVQDAATMSQARIEAICRRLDFRNAESDSIKLYEMFRQVVKKPEPSQKPETQP